MFTCEMCKYTTSVKCNYNKHLTTKKHLRNVELIKTNKVCFEKMSTNEHKMSTNEHKWAQMNTKWTQNEHKNEHKMSTKWAKNEPIMSQ